MAKTLTTMLYFYRVRPCDRVRLHHPESFVMNHALLLNVAILALIVVALIMTNNPVVLLGIAFLKEMPYGLIQQDDSDDDDEEDEKGRPIGFIQGD